jgi:lipopolysaccharide export system protein LptA
MKQFFLAWAMVMAGIPFVMAQNTTPPATNPSLSALGFQSKRGTNSQTVITSDKLTFDYGQRFALFEDNVVVTDPDMNMTSDRLLITFSEENQITSIKADGRVIMTQEDKRGECQTASYDVETGRIVLTGAPKLIRQRDTLEADTITFYRDENRVVCYPRARVKFHPDAQEGFGDVMKPVKKTMPVTQPEKGI